MGCKSSKKAAAPVTAAVQQPKPQEVALVGTTEEAAPSPQQSMPEPEQKPGETLLGKAEAAMESALEGAKHAAEAAIDAVKGAVGAGDDAQKAEPPKQPPMDEDTKEVYHRKNEEITDEKATTMVCCGF
mmetsp:Transcript_99551/g.195573  ORF Transcript_99551/g.195573 Transcript_99551/m.195573 type:complete len:129 (+) Transcript_99551:71-457(+)